MKILNGVVEKIYNALNFLEEFFAVTKLNLPQNARNSEQKFYDINLKITKDSEDEEDLIDHFLFFAEVLSLEMLFLEN